MTRKPGKKYIALLIPVMGLAFSFPCLAQSAAESRNSDSHPGLLKRPEPQFTRSSKQTHIAGPVGPKSQNENSIPSLPTDQGQTAQNNTGAPGQPDANNPYAVSHPTPAAGPKKPGDSENVITAPEEYALQIPDNFRASEPDPENPLKTTIVQWKTDKNEERMIVLSFPRENLAISGHVFVNGRDTTKPQIEAMNDADPASERLTTYEPKKQ